MGREMSLPTNKQNTKNCCCENDTSVSNGHKWNIIKQTFMRFNSCIFNNLGKICKIYSLGYQGNQEITILQITAPTCLTKIRRVTQNF